MPRINGTMGLQKFIFMQQHAKTVRQRLLWGAGQTYGQDANNIHHLALFRPLSYRAHAHTHTSTHAQLQDHVHRTNLPLRKLARHILLLPKLVDFMHVPVILPSGT